VLDRVTGMQVFARVAQLGTLSAAARALGISQTMATKHIAAIEERLGVKLLYRTTRRLTLTEAGRRYLEAAERIVAEVVDAEASAAADRVDPRGTLRVSAPVSFGAREIAPLLPEFAASYPAVNVELGLNDRFVGLIEEGWDVAVRIGQLTESTMIARKLAPCGMVVCAAPSYLANRGTPRSVDDLVDHNCLAYTLLRALGPDRWPFAIDGKVIVPIKGNLRRTTATLWWPPRSRARAWSINRLFSSARSFGPGVSFPSSSTIRRYNCQVSLRYIPPTATRPRSFGPSLISSFPALRPFLHGSASRLGEHLHSGCEGEPFARPNGEHR